MWLARWLWQNPQQRFIFLSTIIHGEIFETLHLNYLSCLLPVQRSWLIFKVTATSERLNRCDINRVMCINNVQVLFGRVCTDTLSDPDKALLGNSGGVVNSLDFCPASLKSLGCFYFRCVLSSQWKAVTVNLRILHCQR